MNTSKHCTFRTFWLGYCDWFRTRAQMSHKEAWDEARREHGPIRRKLFLFPLAIFVLLLILALSAKTLVRQSVAAGASSKHVALASEWGTIFVMGAIAGHVVVSKSIKTARFCRQMCERGQMLEAARATTALNP